MTPTDYPPPVSQLHSRGDVRKKHTLDYLALRLGTEYVPEPGRMVLDKDVWWADTESTEEWPAVHAWRTPAQVASVAAIEPLTELLGCIDEYDDDRPMAELPDVFAAIGPAAIPQLAEYLADPEEGVWVRIWYVDGLRKTSEKHPETCDECIGMITRQLKLFKRQDETFNAFVISTLMDFKAVEAAPLLQQAFEAECIDWSVAGY